MGSRRAIGYLRVSTQERAEHGNGLEAQERAIRAFAKQLGLRLVAVLADEGQSGSNGLDTRTGLATTLVRLERGDADVLVVSRLDRLARSLLIQETVLERLRQRGRDVLSVAEPDASADQPTRVLVRQVLGAIAQYERGVIRGRMLAGKAVKAARGGYTGGRPGYGTRARDRELVANPDERPIVAAIARLRRQGSSYRQICAALEAAGFKPRRAQKWQPATVRRIALRHA